MVEIAVGDVASGPAVGRWVAWVLAVGLSLSVHAQVPAHPPTDPQLKGRSAADVSRMRQMTLDVAVTDRAGSPVSGLQAEDFKVLDDGRVVPVERFEAVVNGGTGATDAETKVEVMLVLDGINASFESLGRTREQVKGFLGRNGGRLERPVSLLLLSDTPPRSRDGLAGKDRSAVLPLANRQAYLRRIPASQDGLALGKALDENVVAMSRITEAQGSAGEAEKVPLSLQALNAIATAARDEAGRKIVIWLGPGWPLLAETNAKTKEALFDSVIYFTNLLRDARITLDMISLEGRSGDQHSDGLPPQGSINGTAIRSGPVSVPTGVANPTYYENFYKGVAVAKQASVNDLALQVLAHQSGGMVLTGDPRGEAQIARCVQEANAFYVLTYELPVPARVGQYRPLEVKVDKAGLAARARLAYYAR